MEATNSHSSPTALHYVPILPFMSDKVLSVVLPLLVYWIYSGFYHIVSECKFSFMEKYRIHTPQEWETKNKVTLGEVLRGVLIQQLLQTLLGLLVFIAEDEDVVMDDAFEISSYQHALVSLGKRFSTEGHLEPHYYTIAYIAYWYLIPPLRFFLAMVLLDTWQYFMHRLFHKVNFLYRHIHSRHHRLYAPYAFGALYNHPFEGFVMDSLGTCLAFKLSGMTTIGALAFFSFATVKTIDDHCGYDIPFNPIQKIFGNNVNYHDIHHQVYGIKMNFSQPFFTIWDRLLGTYMPHRPNYKPTQDDETTTIQTLSLKANGLANDEDRDMEVSMTSDSSPMRYNLRPRKTVSSL